MNFQRFNLIPIFNKLFQCCFHCFSSGFVSPELGNCISTDDEIMSASDETLSSCKLKCFHNPDCKMFSHGDTNSAKWSCLLNGGTFIGTDDSGDYSKYNYKCYQKAAGNIDFPVIRQLENTFSELP